MPFFLLLCLLPLLNSCYVLSQGWQQNNLLNSRQPVVRVLEDPDTPTTVRAKLEEVQRILQYARGAGLNTDGAYQWYVKTSRKAISWVVYVAEPTRLERITWWFPITGSVPYLGFFDKEDRDEEARQLRAEGYDVAGGGVGAFSSLGWFDDPVYTSMLYRSEPALAHLFFHELTHRTIWIGGSVRFNENLAEYVGAWLTVRYLRQADRENQIAKWEAAKRDRILYKKWLGLMREELKKLYASGQSRERLLQGKADIFRKFTGESFPSFETRRYEFARKRSWNNASVLAASLYSPDTERFARAHRCLGGSLLKFLETLEDVQDSYDDAFEALDSLCPGRNGGTGSHG